MRKALSQSLVLSVVLCCTGSVFAQTKAPASWAGITVEVQANRPVESTQKLSEQKDGFQRLAITLSNQGQQPLKIEKITVHIPLAENLTDDLEMVYGGSCMGRTPLLRQNVGSPTAKSSSHMYEIVRLADRKYLFAGSLSWRIFLPTFMLKKGVIEIWSDGEGRQLKPGETIPYEQIVLRHAGDWLALLDQFGVAIAAENSITRLKPTDFKGWATWDYYGRVFTAKDICGNMDALNRLAPEANMVQIDGGWWTERGDYKSVRTDLLPGGIKEIVSRTTSEGKIPGIHLDGFRGDANSEIYKTHPEYFLHEWKTDR